MRFFARRAQGLQQGEDARVHVFRTDGLNHFDVVVVFACGQAGKFGIVHAFAAVGENAAQGIVTRDAFELFVEGAVDMDALFFGEFFPGQVVVFGGVGDDAVKVEEDGLVGHGCSPVLRDSSSGVRGVCA